MTHNWTLVRPQIVGGNDNGTFTFRQNRPFDPANGFTYPSRFSIRLGQIYFDPPRPSAKTAVALAAVLSPCDSP